MEHPLELSFARLDVIHPPNEKIHKAQRELNEVKDIVRNNIQLVMQRNEKLDALKARAGVMEAGAAQFTLNATNFRRKLWWKSVRTMTTLVALCIFSVVGTIGRPLHSLIASFC
ncbi:unnamed protein product [Anisakis simplex]|uniref:V-SNARE coiled-coil homology domain-containing protein n=1 Tax=Anisakis simplex TaxID=6269 RepID=A0A0M3KBB9_ANISI|nr:unnamed protein product [Anisakis simplex]